jgi:uncharacterized protein
MPEYLYPGVYVEEIDTGNKPIEGVSTSTVGFLGIAERGPTVATYVTSYTEFIRSFGSYYKDSKGNQAFLAYAVEGFFLNGGLRCWVARVTSLASAKTASVKLAEQQISATGPGAYGGQIGYQIEAASLDPANLFKLTLYYWPTPALAAAKDKTTAAQVEQFDNLSPSPNSSTYYVGAVNGFSNLATLTQLTQARPANMAAIALLDGSGGGVKGDDGSALGIADFKGSDTDPENRTGLKALAAIDDISLLCCPDEGAIALPPGSPPNKSPVADELLAQCEDKKDRFAILQARQNAGVPATVLPSVASKRGYAAFYYPWLRILDPKTNAALLVPPGGHIAGIYARSDNNRNVAKDPANEQILAIDSLQVPIDNQLQATLNPIGVNCLRYFRGQGNLVWGGRTVASDPDWKYINVRRLFIFVEKSIERGTQWVVFEPNDEATWARVRRSVSDFLTGLWRDDMLQGARREDAFFVRCDRTTMTQADIDNGRLIMVIGIAPVKPAEFVIFRIGQWTGGSDVSEA